MKKIQTLDIWSDECEIVFIGDTHIGAKAFCEKTLQKYLDWVLEHRERYIIGMGDYLELALSAKHIGTAMMEQRMGPQHQIDKFLEMFQPVAHRIITLLSGNHGKRLAKIAQLDMVKNLGRQLRPVPMKDSQGYYGFIRLSIGANPSRENEKRVTRKVTLGLHHGAGSSKYEQHFLGRLIYENTWGYFCDGVVVGHNHQLFHDKFPILGLKGTRITTVRNIHGIRSGSAMDYAEYAGEAGLPPTELGFPIMYLDVTGNIQVAKGLSEVTW